MSLELAVIRLTALEHRTRVLQFAVVLLLASQTATLWLLLYMFNR